MPTLFLGLVFGSFFGHCIRLFVPISDGLLIVLGLAGMSAFFAGSIRGPVTAVVITAEITGSYELILPIFISVIISFLMASKLSPEDLYTKSLLQKGVILADSFADMMDAIPISKAMIPASQVYTLAPHQSCSEVLALAKATDYDGFPVLENGQLHRVS